MAKQLNVNLAFTADTGKAKQQLQDLQNSLTKLINTTSAGTSEFGLTKELAQATSEASKLKAMLSSATTSTGTLDLGQLNQALQKSGTKLSDYASTLQSLGPEGAATFSKLAQAITTANVPLKQTNALLSEFATTMKNTVRWQLSSSVLHGFMGAMQSAYGYAQDLNESLNNIRIVTGYNIEEMDKFAERANRAAKALSTTTTEYTNASLIYYQQGLPEEQIQERTAVTIKMANAAGVSAEKVSNQMTAVWNNFYDGSKSLEYYADVMTALGAATASSTDEISAGLNKFAAVAETVGLSYEYATSALATVTAETRESADIVGTAFKTLFARIQGLTLGETLEDGTDLNKYSDALLKVGIDIKDANGQMKNMDTILDELGNKWNTLGKDQQIALAQTVAGVRQYTQLVALMDNWDTFQDNLITVGGAEGALEEQAEIYAESWEAARDRVTAAAEGIYDQLLDDKFFISLNNLLANALGQIGNLIDGLGGLPGVLSVISTFMLKAFGGDIAESLERMVYNIKLGSENGRKQILELRESANAELKKMYNDRSTPVDSAYADVYSKQADIQKELLKTTLELESKNKSLTEEEQKQAQLLLDINQKLGEQYIKTVEARDAQQDITDDLIKQSGRVAQTENVDYKNDEGEVTETKNYKAEIGRIRELQEAYVTGTTLLQQYRKASSQAFNDKDPKAQGEAFKKIKQHISQLKSNAEATGVVLNKDLVDAFEKLEDITIDEDGTLKDAAGNVITLQQALDGLETDLDKIGDDAYNSFEKLRSALSDSGANMSKLSPILDKIWESFSQTGKLTGEQIQLFANLGIQVDEAGNIINNFHGKVYTTADSLVALANVVTGLSTVWNSLKGLSDIWSDEDLTYGDKVVNTLTTLATVVTTVMGAYKAWNDVKLTGITNDILSLALKQKENQLTGAGLKLKLSENALQALENKQLTTEIILKTILNALDWKKLAICAALVVAIGALVAVGKLLYDAYNADAQAAAEANDQAKMLTERYQELASAAEELNEAIADYEDARDALSELEKGTEAYADALEDANEKARDLIETYGLWDDYEYKDGQITFKPGALENLQNEADKAAEKAKIQMYQGEIYANAADIRSQSTDLTREVGYFGTGQHTTTGVSSTAYGAGVNSNVSTSPYAASQQTSNVSIERTRKITNDEVQIIAGIADDLEESLGGVSPTAEQLIAEINRLGAASGLNAEVMQRLDDIITSETIGSFLSLGDSMSEAEAANRYYAEQILGMAIEDNYGDDIADMATDDSGNINEVKYNQIVTAFANRAAQDEAERGNNIEEDYKAVENTVKDIKNTGDLTRFLKNYDDSVIKQVLGDDFDGKINNDKELGLMYAAMLSGKDISELTYKKGNGVGSVKDKDGNDIFSGVSDEVMRREIAKQVAMQAITNKYSGNTKDNAALDELKTALNTMISGTAEATKKYGADFSSAILDSIANEDFDSLDFSGLFKELDPEEMAELSGLDSQGILDLLGLDNETLTALDYDTETFTTAFSDALNKWTYQLDTSGLEAKAATLQEVMDDLETGSIVTEETYNELSDLGINVEDYFTKMADGTYILTDAASDFLGILKKSVADDYIKKIKEAEAARTFANQKVSEEYAGTAAGNYYLDTSKVLVDGMGSETQRLAQARAEYLKTAGGQDVFGFTDEQAALLEKTSWTNEELHELATMMGIASQGSVELQGQLLSTATSLSELNSLMLQMSTNGITNIDYSAYANALIGLASAYDNCTAEIKAYQEALAVENNEVAIKAAEDALEASIMMGEAAENYDLDAEVLETQADLYQTIYEKQNLSRKAAANLAIQNQRLNKGVSTLSSNWEDWNTIIKRGDKASSEYAEVITDLKNVMKDLVGVSDDFEVSTEFIEDHMSDIEKAAAGDAKAIEDLGFELAYASTEAWSLDESMMSLLTNSEDFGPEYVNNLRTAFDENLTTVQTGIERLQEAVKSGAIGVGATWETLSQYLGSDWVTALNEMAIATGMTVTEMENLLASMNIDANVTVTPVKQSINVPEYTTAITPNGSMLNLMMGKPFSYSSSTWQTGTRVEEGYIDVPQISYGEDTGGPQVTYTGGGNVSKSSVQAPTGGGSNDNDTSSELKSTSKSSIVERYKEVNDLIDDITDAYDDASAAADRLYGKDRIAKMQAMNGILSDEIGLLEKKRQEAQDYLDIVDKPNLEAVGASYGLKFEFDKEGNISNYESQMSALYDELHGVEESVKEGGVTSEEQELIDAVKEKIEAVEGAIQQYDDTRELITDSDKEIQDTINKIQDTNYEIMEAKLDLDLAVQADELERIEYYLDKISDDFYHAAEGAAYLANQIELSQENIKDYRWFIGALAEEYNTIDEKTGQRKISQADYIEGLKETRSAIYDELNTLNELDDEMINYYGDTLSSAQEELSTYTDRMEHLNSVLDHYQNLMEITGKSTNYENLTAVLQGQADLIKNSYEVSKANYEWLKSEADDLKVLMDDAQAAGNTAAYEGYRNEWLAAQAAAEEAQDEMLSQAAEWAEAMKTIVSTKLEELSKVLEESLTADFGSFDELSKNMERASSLQEEYLTTTNKIYETTKLMRTAQGVIDTTTNTVAKQRLKGFIEETAQLQNKNKLSQYELEIQQAKYDLLLAEIALEEAQNAKSTVTLRRDSEGNFGYVYTADQDQIAGAEQELEDAQNRLYNIGLEGANDYTQKYQETLNQMHDKISELTQAWLNGEIESEQEYHAKMQDIKDFYYEKLKDYSELYQVAISTDSAIVAEAWSTEFASMTNDTENWMTKVDEYVGGCSEVFQEWQGTIAEIEQMAGQDLDNLATGVSDITTESDRLVEAITKEDGVLDTLAKQLDGTQLVTDAYIAQRDALQEVISEMETYLRTVDGMIAAESGQANNLGTPLTGNNSSITGNNSSSTDNSSTTDTTSNTNTTSTTNQNNGDDTLTNNSDKAEGVAAAIWLDGSSKSGWGKGDTRFARFKEKGVSEAQSIINNRSGELYNKYKNKKLSDYYYDAFDTGGYTGEWGSYGKLAMLHEKELILNQDDTANFLASIDILRNIVKVLDLQAAYSQLDNQLSSPGYYYPEEESILEQNVHIEASFPNVENRSEIEEAFNNLINQASQYANRKR